MTAWRTYARTYALVGSVVLVPIVALAGGPQSSGRGGQSQGDQTQAQQGGQQEAQQRGQQGQQHEFPSPYDDYSATQMQQIGRQANQDGTVTIDKAIQQAQQRAKGRVVAADFGYVENPQKSGEQSTRGRQAEGSQMGGSVVQPVWQVEIISPEEGRLTQVLVDAESGEVKDVQEYPLAMQ